MGGPEMKDTLQRIAAEKKITIPMTFLPQGPNASDVGYYRINPQAKNTILVYTHHQVHANLVDVDPTNLADVDKAAADMLQR